MSKGGRGGSYRSSRYRSSRYRSSGGTYYSGGTGYHDGNWDTLDIIGLLLECAIVLIGLIAIIYLIWKYICQAKKEDSDNEEKQSEVHTRCVMRKQILRS